MSSLVLDMRAERLPSISEALTSLGYYSALCNYSVRVRARVRVAKGDKATPVLVVLILQLYTFIYISQYHFI